MSTYTVGENELMRLLGHPELGHDALFSRALTLYAAARGRGRGCCGHRSGPAGMAMWRSSVAAALHRHVSVHPGIALSAARQVFGLATDASAVVRVNGQSVAL